MEKGVREMRVIIIQTIVVIETDEEPVRGESGLAEAFKSYLKLRPLMLEQQDEQRQIVAQ